MTTADDASNGSAVAHDDGLVVVFVDPLYDFLHPKGAFAEANEGKPHVRRVLPELLELASASFASPHVQTVLVTSLYQPNQFRSCPMLCTTNQGRQSMIPEAGFDLIMTKTANSLLYSAEREQLLALVKGRRVLVCGVTTAHCVKQAVLALSECGSCQTIVVAENAVGHTGPRGGRQMKDWPSLFDGVSVVPAWQQVLYPPQHYAYREMLAQQRGLVALGEGDSFFVPNVLSETLVAGDDATLLDRVLQEVKWEKMLIRGKAVFCDVAIQVVQHQNGGVPLYRNPGWESLTSLPTSPTVEKIRLDLQDRLGLHLNHVKLQLYKDGSVTIGRHSDKTIDISHGSPIVNVSLGCPRVFSLTHKETGNRSDFDMMDNSCFLLGWHTNRTHWHHVDKAQQPTGARISMVFRHISTYQMPDGSLCGQGARRGRCSKGIDDRDELIQAFSSENRESDLRWSDLYLGGSNVIE